MAKIFLGTLNIDGKPAVPGTKYGRAMGLQHSPRIGIGDTQPWKDITWDIIGDVLVASYNVLLDVDWQVLNFFCLSGGRLVNIDHLPFVIRLPAGGPDLSEPTELRQMVRQLDRPENDYLSWGQDETEYSNAHLAWMPQMDYNPSYKADGSDKGMGWRPVLDPVRIQVDDTRVGQQVWVWTKSGHGYVGILSEYSDYDLMLESACHPIVGSDRNHFGETDGDRVVIDRSGVWCVQPYQGGLPG